MNTQCVHRVGLPIYITERNKRSI